MYVVAPLFALLLVLALCSASSSPRWVKQNLLSGLKNGSSGRDAIRNLLSAYKLNTNGGTDPEVSMNVTEIIRYHGYPVQSFTVPTSDGFLLGVQRIPRGRHDNDIRPRPMVFIQHGLLCSSTNWVTNLPNESLAFLLADAGFDVWLGNIRGNTYSKRHKTLLPNQKEFWAWSWDEHASLDLPAMLDYALKVSGASDLYYIGHSQGTLIAFAHLSQDPKLSQKVKMLIAMGPVIKASHVVGPIRFFAEIAPGVQDLFDLFGVYDFLPNDLIMDFLARTFCSYKTRFICKDILFLFAGFDTSNFNQSRLPVYLSHTPAGASVQNMEHFSQMVRFGTFQMYDFGTSEKNKKKYGQETPPMYNITNVKVPVILFSGEKDWLADVQDVAILAKALPNLVHHYSIPGWNHLDFLWGVDAPKVVYNKIIKYIKEDVAKGRRHR